MNGAVNQPIIEGLSHVAIVVTNLDEARSFYCEALGLTELPRPDLGIPGMWLQVGSLQLHFIESDTMPIPGPGFPHLALHIPADRWDETLAELRRVGVMFPGEPSTRFDFGVQVRVAFVRDPAGNTIELTDVGPLLG
jgi:glyoxylase I family protein